MQTKLLVFCFFFSIIIYAQNSYKLTVDFKNITTNQGILRLSVYNNELDFLKTAFLSCEINNSETTKSCTFILKQGNYSLAAYLDKNSNNILDKNMFRIPLEEYAFSNNFRPKFSAPKFSDSKFELNKNLILNLSLKKWP